MKKGAIILATALASLVSKGNFANASQIKENTKHQIVLNLDNQHNKQEKNTLYMTGEKSHDGVNHEPDTLADHQTIISTTVEDIVMKYGQVK
jgi:hypothetical protein